MTLRILFVLAFICHAATAGNGLFNYDDPVSETVLEPHSSSDDSNDNNNQTSNDVDTLAYTAMRRASQCTVINGTSYCSMIFMNCTKQPEQEEICQNTTSSSTGELGDGDTLSDFLDDLDFDIPWSSLRDLESKFQRFLSTFWTTIDPFDNDEDSDIDDVSQGY